MFNLEELLKATNGKLVKGKRDLTIQGISIDSRTLKKNEAFIAIKGNNFDGHNFIDEAIKKGASCIIEERENKQQQIRNIAFVKVRDTQKALGDIARFQRNKFATTVIAITGSNGKTTTKEMIAQILSRRYNVLKNEGTKNNQIGLSLTLLGLKAQDDIAVLEIGTNHFGEVKTLSQITQPNIGIITNIGPAHLEGFCTLRGVFKEKNTLLENLQKPHLAILNTDDDLLRKNVLKKIKKPIIFGFGIEHKSDFFAAHTQQRYARLEFTVNSKYRFHLKTLGYHNIYNALAAIAVARLFNIEYRDIILGLANFDFPENRLKLKQINKIRFIDDTYNSNPLSLKEALNSLANFKTRGRKIFVMGDMLELGKKEELFHYETGRQIARVCDAFIAVGRLSQQAAHAAQTHGLDMKNIFTCEDSWQARDILFNKIILNKDDVVLVKGSRLMKMEEVFK